MAVRQFSFAGFVMRLVAALVLVFATYNPEKPYSYFYWALKPLAEDVATFTVLKGFIGVILIIAWSIFLRATFRSLGAIGTILAIAFFTMLLWLVVDWGWIVAGSVRTISYLVLGGLSGVLAAGISWSHIRRRITGQLDVDDSDE